ncbi:MAG: glycosyltransferase family 87 protein [Parvularculaceae bacterium]|nr:glycosyltransferase family 87 protein [Parvularculaceae bacterium]
MAAGGPVFAIILMLTSLFTALLFDLRADKIFALPSSIVEASAEDLVAFERAAAMAAEGRASETYDPSAFRAGLSPQHKGMLWLNPPHALLLVAPLADAPYDLAKLWLMGLTVLSLAFIGALARAPFWMIAALIVSPAAFASLLVMQTGPLIAFGLLSALLLAPSRPMAAGLVLALLTVKPQYGLMAPVFLAALGQWRAVGWAAAFSAGFAALSVAAYGAAPWAAFFNSMTGGAISVHGANLHRDMLSVGSTLLKLGAGPFSGAGQVAAIIICGALTFVAARRLPRDAAIGMALLASAAASPSFWVYDWPLIAAGLIMLARATPPWPPMIQLAAGLLWIGPLYSLGLGTIASSLIAPLLLMATLAGFALWLARARPAGL